MDWNAPAPRRLGISSARALAHPPGMVFSILVGLAGASHAALSSHFGHRRQRSRPKTVASNPNAGRGPSERSCDFAPET